MNTCRLGTKLKSSDNCFLLKNGNIVRITKIVGNSVFFRKFRNISSVSLLNLDSCKLGIFKVSSLIITEEITTVDSIRKKIMLLPSHIVNPEEQNKFMAMPLCSDMQYTL